MIPFQKMHEIVAFLSAHTQVLLTFHLIGVAVGMGGATIADFLFFNFLRDFRISKKEAEVLHILSNVIMVALGILYLSGLGLFFSNVAVFSQSSAFIAKASIVVVITINGILMHKFIAPHMVKLSFLRHPLQSTRQIHTLRAVAFGMGAISFTSWYSVFFIAMLKSYLPPHTTVLQIIAGYGFILICAISVSQIVHFFLHKRSLLA